jgi:magnesium-transporting ATPase (P-type)
MAQKKLDDKVYNDWKLRYEKINTGNSSEKEKELLDLYDELEYDLDYVGASAIEDLLQDQVPETIKILL